MIREEKIIINCRFLTQPITGVQRFAIEICRELKKMDAEFVFVTPKNVLHPEIFQELNAIVIGRFRGHLWEQIELKRYVNKCGALLISLGNTGPLFVKNQIITIHDLGFMHYPEWFSFKFRKVYNFLIPRLAKKAIHIFTVSETSKKDIATTLQIDTNKVSVIYNGIPSVFKKSFDNSKLEHHHQKFILTVSSHVPRKNYKRLINAFLRIEDKNVKLIIVGNFSTIYKSEELSKSSKVIFKENVKDEELIKLYNAASLFIYPSLYEGFGIPIIEAASCGTNICVSDIPVFKEICENEAIYFNPLDEADITKKIEIGLKTSIFPNPTFFQKKYCWKKSALKLQSILEYVRSNNS